MRARIRGGLTNSGTSSVLSDEEDNCEENPTEDEAHLDEEVRPHGIMLNWLVLCKVYSIKISTYIKYMCLIKIFSTFWVESTNGVLYT